MKNVFMQLKCRIFGSRGWGIPPSWGGFSTWGGSSIQGVPLSGGFSIQGVGGFSIWGFSIQGVPSWGVLHLGDVPCDLSNHAFDVTCMLPPHQLRHTNCAPAYILPGHVTCNASWDTHPPCGQTDTCKNITFANYVCGR